MKDEGMEKDDREEMEKKVVEYNANEQEENLLKKVRE